MSKKKASLKGKRIVITGGSGFIGSNLAHAFSGLNEVTIVDDLSTGRYINIAALVDKRDVEFVRGSITDTSLMKRVLADADIVLHQAALPSVTRSVRDPLTTNHANIDGTLSVLLAARKCDTRKVVFASSSSVYGESKTLPKSEDMVPDPVSPYALTKLTGERYCDLFHRLYGLSTISLRYFNVFGPRQDPSSEYSAVIPKFMSNAIRGVPLGIYGDGNQTRDFTYVEDVIQANKLAANSKESGVFNIARGTRTKIRQLANLVIEMVGSKSRICYQAARPGDIRHSLADISKAERILGFLPTYSLKEGLFEMYRSFATDEGRLPNALHMHGDSFE